MAALAVKPIGKMLDLPVTAATIELHDPEHYDDGCLMHGIEAVIRLEFESPVPRERTRRRNGSKLFGIKGYRYFTWDLLKDPFTFVLADDQRSARALVVGGDVVQLVSIGLNMLSYEITKRR